MTTPDDTTLAVAAAEWAGLESLIASDGQLYVGRCLALSSPVLLDEPVTTGHALLLSAISIKAAELGFKPCADHDGDLWTVGFGAPPGGGKCEGEPRSCLLPAWLSALHAAGVLTVEEG